MRKEWIRSPGVFLWFLLIVVVVLLLIISVVLDCRGEDLNLKWNPILERYEIREGFTTKAYLYRDRWTETVKMKDARTNRTLQTWKYNRWLKRWELKSE